MGAVVVVAIVSDTHLPRGARRLPDACVEKLRCADAIVHAGDFVTREVLETLRALGPPVTAVHGNVDEPALRKLLPEAAELSVGDSLIAVLHDAGPASGRLERMRRRFPRADAVVFGHSHIPLLEAREGFAIFNPGSPTDRRRQPVHTMGVARVRADGSLEFELVGLGI